MRIVRYITKLHLINWHYIEYKTINLSNRINYLTGETGSGKSTILDALQLIILGDLKGHYFNKAANENSKRKLIEYLKGMIQENSTEGKKFLRDKIDFNSYIVIEVLNSTTNETFCLGVVFEVKKDSNNLDHSFFRLKGSLPQNGFVTNNKPLSIKEIKEEYGKLLKTYSTEEYTESFLNEYMGKLKKGFYDVFKRAVAFKPPSSIEEFISKFICDDIKIDVEDMVVPIKIYKKMEQEAQKTENQIQKLQEICDKFNKYSKLKEEYKFSRYVYDRSNYEIEEIKLLKLKEELKDAKRFIENGNIQRNELDKIIKDLEEKINKIKYNIEHSDKNVLSNEIEDLNKKIDDCKRSKKLFDSEVIKFERWNQCLDFYSLLNENNDIDIINFKREIGQMRLYNLHLENFFDLNTRLKDIQKHLQKRYDDAIIKIKEFNTENDKLNEELNRLSNGIVYPKYIEKLKEIFQNKLLTLYGSNIEVNILADLIDIKDKTWLDALEGYMNKQKYYLIVDPKYYQDILDIYNKLDKTKYYDVGIVDIEKIINDNYKVIDNSLAEEVITNNEYARVYVDYLLGRVIKCDDINKIRNYRTAITKDCFLYKGYIARRLNPDLYLRNRCIGSETRRMRINELKKELDTLKKAIDCNIAVKDSITGYFNLKVYSKEEIENKIFEQEKIVSIKMLEEEKLKKEEELSKVDLLYIESLEKEYKNLVNEKEIKNNVKEKLIKEIGNNEGTCNKVIQQIIEQESRNIYLQKQLNNNYGIEWIEDVGASGFENELSKYKKYNTMLTIYEEKKIGLEDKIKNAFGNIKELRRNYCVKNGLTWNSESEENKRFLEQLNMLVETKFPEYLEKIELQRKKAYDAFKNDLLSRLKDAIDKTEEQISFINRSLNKISFGEKKYRFIVKPKAKYREFYDMLKFEFLGMDLGADIFASQYKDQIEFLFNLIINTTEELKGNELEQLRKQIDIYTDYKTYLEFDMEQTAGEDISDLSKTLEKNSGGETQSPFFIAVLAAFANHYRIYNTKDSDAMRLIIFDEAFSKMDEGHSRMSIELLRKLGFQAIIAAPDDKIPVIGPNSDKIIYVKNQNKRKISLVEFDDEEIDDLINGVV